MGDRELLELAAKAAGIQIGSPGSTGGFYVCEYIEQTRTYGPYRVWNPLTDDGDALRLAVKLWLEVCCRINVCVRGPLGIPEVWEKASGDKCAATRRAIVLAAAEIGKATASAGEGGKA